METFIAFILIVLFGHFIADFIFQTDWQAKNKSKNLEALSRHILSYTVCMTVLGWVAADSLNLKYVSPYSIWLFAIITLASHFITDFFTSKFNSKMWASQKYKLFWTGIGFDQFLHATQLILTSYYCFFKQ